MTLQVNSVQIMKVSKQLKGAFVALMLTVEQSEGRFACEKKPAAHLSVVGILETLPPLK